MTFLVRRIGPYHHARFTALGAVTDLTVIETRPASCEYPWTTRPEGTAYARRQLPAHTDPERPLPRARLAVELTRLLGETEPAVLACSGWADAEYHVALAWGGARGVPSLLMSDSTHEDERRRPWREWLKGSVVLAHAAAVVAGARSRAYLSRLGFPETAIRAPLDVVDNAHFAAPDVTVSEVPRNFLCVARFVPKKNLARLLEAYAGYAAGCRAPWTLTLSGSGPLEANLRQQVASLGLGEQVRFAGFQQYPALPALYAGAGALVLPSVSDQWGLVVNEAMAAGRPVLVSQRCGCAPDLVRDGENGWTFDPLDTAGLQHLLRHMGSLETAAWSALSRRSRALIAAYSPDAFAAAVRQAAELALDRAHRRIPRLSRAAVGLLTRATPGGA